MKKFLILCGIFLLPVIYFPLDMLFHGPFVVFYNKKKLNQANKGSIMGKTEREVISVLGEPSFSYSTGKNGKTLNYCPVPFLNGAKFQVHLENDHVFSIEELDD